MNSNVHKCMTLNTSIDPLRAAQLFDVAQYDKQQDMDVNIYTCTVRATAEQEEVNEWIFTLAPLAPAPLQSCPPVIPSFSPKVDSAFHSI